MRTLRTLCSGGELFGVGARQAGYQHLDGYEIEPTITAVARLNGFDVRAADVCEVDYAALPPVDHLHVSPSCKNASQANQRGKDENGNPLPRETAGDRAVADATCRAIMAHQGATFTLENVWGYRTFASFEAIRAALVEAGFSYDYWHLNSADYGVPQTRKRLILIARRGLCRIQRPHPTHRDGGDRFHVPWVGWYAAIEDILDTLPPTKPAPWQLARLPEELRETVMIHPAETRSMTARGANCPRFDCDSTVNAGQFAPRAFIVGGGNTGWEKVTSHARAADEPMFTVRDGRNDSPERALLISGKTAPRALLLDGQTGSYGTNMTYREGGRPAFTIRANSNERQAVRGYVGRWVRMTVQAMGRFQTVPDDYQGLTSEINGNGVPCLLARRIMEAL